MRWIVEGADRETGKEMTVPIEATSKSHAEQIASGQGLLVSKVRSESLAAAEKLSAMVPKVPDEAEPAPIPVMNYKSAPPSMGNGAAQQISGDGYGDYAKRMGIISRFRRRVGHRSFIFQLWLLAWTIAYVTWIGSMLMSAGSHGSARAPGPSAFGGASPFNAADEVAVLTSSWMCAAMGWGVVGLPIGIAAVATMENNKA